MLNKSKKIAKSKKNEKTQKGSSYIDKIREITGGEELDSIDLSDENLIEKKPNNACSLLDMDEKQEKSRQSARETRKRRKLYMQLLEKKVINLTEENKSLQAKNLLLENKVLAHQNSEIMTKVQNERKKLFDKLENAINSKDELEINCILDALRLRLGLAGKTRLQALSSIFSEVVNMMMPFHMKYVLWISANCLDIFREDNDTDSVDSANWFSNIGLSDKQIKDIQQEVLKQKQEYDEILLNFNQIRKNIIVQNEKSQNFIDDLRNVFPTINTAKFLLDLDRKRGHYVSDKIYPEQFWSDLLEQDFKKPMEKVPLAQLKEEVEQHMESEQLSPYINGYNQNGNQERQNQDNSFNQLSLMQQLRGPDHN
ncbi:hypothetical protein PPERSA_04861 [Pseudocohnilembus persalinus]|uniref:BZIP domain-containing protein n=1 Tax=Pseudocohnilembus persalinus TaxID=266149 RepID=A0A0V0QIW2_PSEPJ|nr:hypothetical protein PPERSA_04861 [Pseudocohnilembus persalinus]|eukprot:KRX02239.1 hypothetical protein PPERSA_04861 [Pseudocohnilembus persalinus]